MNLRVLVVGVFLILVATGVFLYRLSRDRDPDYQASKLTSHDDPANRLAAARRLGALGGRADSAIGDLTYALADSDRDVRQAAAEALDQIDAAWRERAAVAEVASHLTKELARAPQTPNRRLALLFALETIGPKVRVTNVLIEQLGDESADIRRLALDDLDRLSTDWRETVVAREMMQTSFTRLNYASSDKLEGAVFALDQIHPSWTTTTTAKQALVRLIVLMTSQEPEKRTGAELIAKRIDPVWHNSTAARQAIRPLVTEFALGGESGKLAARVLARIDPSWKESPTARDVFDEIELGPFTELAAECFRLLSNPSVPDTQSSFGAWVEYERKQDPMWGFRRDQREKNGYIYSPEEQKKDEKRYKSWLEYQSKKLQRQNEEELTKIIPKIKQQINRLSTLGGRAKAAPTLRALCQIKYSSRLTFLDTVFDARPALEVSSLIDELKDAAALALRSIEGP